MGVFSEMENKLVAWSFGIAVQKVIPKVALFLATLAVAKWGANVDVTALQAALGTILFAFLDIVRNFVKVKTGLTFL